VWPGTAAFAVRSCLYQRKENTHETHCNRGTDAQSRCCKHPRTTEAGKDDFVGKFCGHLQLAESSRDDFFLASLVYGTPCISRDDPGISQHGFLLKPVAASAERRLAHHRDIGRCRPNWPAEMAVYSLAGKPAIHFKLNHRNMWAARPHCPANTSKQEVGAARITLAGNAQCTEVPRPIVGGWSATRKQSTCEAVDGKCRAGIIEANVFYRGQSQGHVQASKLSS